MVLSTFVHFCVFKHFFSRLSIYLDVCVQNIVAIGNNQSARLLWLVTLYYLQDYNIFAGE